MLAIALTILYLSLTTSAAPSASMMEIRKPDHWGTIAWGKVGFGACNISSDDNFVAAVSPLLYDNEHPCGCIMVVTYGENKVTVEVVDRCADCTDNDLVLSPPAFQKLVGDIGGENIGFVNATWDFQLGTQCQKTPLSCVH